MNGAHLGWLKIQLETESTIFLPLQNIIWYTIPSVVDKSMPYYKGDRKKSPNALNDTFFVLNTTSMQITNLRP